MFSIYLKSTLFEPQNAINIMLIEKDKLALNTKTKVLKVSLCKITFSWDKSRVKLNKTDKKRNHKNNWKFSHYVHSNYICSQGFQNIFSIKATNTQIILFDKCDKRVIITSHGFLTRAKFRNQNQHLNTRAHRE